jgi:hypothetical protein
MKPNTNLNHDCDRRYSRKRSSSERDKIAIPVKLAEVIDLALVKKPEIHFNSAAEFKIALLRVA